ncbi:MAG: hypothetical protein ACLQUY_15905 [Ktedonobacterales bacterium]
MRKRIIMGVAGASLILVGVLAGFIISGGIPAFASKSANNAASVSQSTPSAANGYCQLYEQTLARQLNISPSALESANSAALKAVIEQMAKDGKITSQQETKLLQMVQQYSSQPCSHLNQFAHWANGNTLGSLNQILAGGRQSIANAVATSLGITTSVLASDLKAGQTIPEIASGHGVTVGTVNTAYLGALKSLLSQAVSKGDITQDQSNTLYSQVTTSVNAGRYPLLGGFGGAGGRFGGKRPTPPTPTPTTTTT